MLWRPDREVHGLELLCDTVLLALRRLSISYWLRCFLPGPDDPRHTTRDNAIDGYCVFQLLALLILIPGCFGPVVDSVVAGYILFEIYLNLFNIVFIGKIRVINSPPVSIERSLLLLFLNVFEVVLAFGILYRDWLKLSTVDGFFKAVLVLGTIGYPQASGWWVVLIALQVLLDFVLVVLVFSSFAGQVGLFRSASPPPATASPSNEPLQRRGSTGR
jgi:hypothetical protein